MRDIVDKLRKCPTCGSEVEEQDIGLRDYSTWLFDCLPGKQGATDFDAVIERKGNFLLFEFKTSRYVPRGQSIAFTALHYQGWTIYVVVEKGEGQYDVARWVPGSLNLPWYKLDLDGLKTLVRNWYDEADQD